MKKLLIITLFLAGTAMAETWLTYQEYSMIKPDNQKPSVQIKARTAMKHIAKVDQEQVGKIFKSRCEDAKDIVLQRKGWYLYYVSDACDIRVNALDGTVRNN